MADFWDDFGGNITVVGLLATGSSDEQITHECASYKKNLANKSNFTHQLYAA